MNTPTQLYKYFLLPLILIGLSLSSFADDLDIYSSLSNSGSTDTANHNILFVMDTSGSMASATAGLARNGNYDPDTDYGSSDDLIYVYDTELDFTGTTITYEQNVCDSMTSVFNTSTSYPVYPDLVYQWQQSDEVIDGGQTCTTTPATGTTYSGSDSFSNDKNDWFTLIDDEIDAGSEFSITIYAEERVNVYVETYKDGEYWDNYEYWCYNEQIGGNKPDSVTCSGTAPSDHDYLILYVKVRTNKSFDVDYDVTIGSTGGEVCSDNPDTTFSQSEWRTNLVTSNDSSSVVECFNDAGNHGVDDGSNITYLAECGFGNTCNAPSYTTESGDEISWTNPSLQYFVPANYHDFLQNGGGLNSDNALDDPQDASTYCDRTSRIGDVFVDTTSGLIYECFSRLEVMQDSVSNLVNSLSQSPINIGLMRFNKTDDSGNGTSGGTVVNAIGSISTNLTTFEDKLYDLPASGGTPLSESLYEAYLYYKGGNPDLGRQSDCGTDGVTCTDSAALTAGKYKSPITDSCQSNNIIFLSDGQPSSSDGDRDTEIKAAAGVSSCGTTTDPNSSAGKCLDEMAQALAENDLSTTVDGENNVTTYTIGLDLDLELLEDTANKGNGEYFTATDSGDLEEAFRDIVLDILSDTSSFTAPAVSVNAFNRLSHRDEVYYATFEPAGTPRWMGNIKKYKISSDGVIDIYGNEVVVTEDNRRAGEENDLGEISSLSRSYWSDTQDGSRVDEGGFVKQLDYPRNIYTEDNSDTLIKLASDNFVDIDAATLNVGNTTTRDNVLKWLMGSDDIDYDLNSETTIAQFAGDTLHSRPIVITYGGTADEPEDVLFALTNLGMLHAINPDNDEGSELWAYIPEEHLDNPIDYIEANNTTQHTYGLDGQITIVQTEADDSTSTEFALSKVQMFFGERRGGSRYYALDISNARRGIDAGGVLDNSYDTPFKRLWSIQGALQGTKAETATPTSADSGFRDLAQTWSRMIPTKLSYTSSGSPVTKNVFIFSGGYDPRHDSATYKSTNTESDYGNAIYIVDAETGALLYSIGNNNDDDDPNRDLDQHDLNLNMRDSITASPTVIDINGDGDVDTIFAIDITGHIWRIDFDQTLDITSNSYATGGMIFDLSETTTDADTGDMNGVRRFFNVISASRSDPTTGSDHLNLAVGSGYRASPSFVEPFSNRIYILFDPYVTKRTLGTGVAEDDRYNYASDDGSSYRTATSSDLSLTAKDDPKTIFTSPNGIYIELTGTGEKAFQVLSTFNSRLFFTTYVTDGGISAGACGGNLGSARAYTLNITNGLSILTEEILITDTDDDGNVTETVVNNTVDYIEIETPGIAANPTVIFRDGDPNDPDDPDDPNDPDDPDDPDDPNDPDDGYISDHEGNRIKVCIGLNCTDEISVALQYCTASPSSCENMKDFPGSQAVKTYWHEIDNDDN